MLNTSETTAIIVVLVAALLLVIWSYNRARVLGTLGILGWLQSLVLLAPWLILFSLLLFGITPNLPTIFAILLSSLGIYIYLGNRLRQVQPSIGVVEKIVLNEVSRIPTEDISQLKAIFGIDTFFATETISYQEGAIFKGNLRGEPAEAHAKLSSKLKDIFSDRYRLFLVESPEEKPVVIILPSLNDPPSATLAQKNLALVLMVATVFTSLEAAGMLLGFDWFNQVARYREVLPLALGLMTILLAHEMGHRLVAKYYQVRMSVPFFIPTWQMGCFGAISRFESIIANRLVLFDISIAGPALGGLVSFLILLGGLIFSASDSVIQIPSQFFRGSILVGTLAHLVLGDRLQDTLVAINPFVILGWLGLVITALNLLPAGQLDGGRIILAIYGRKIARRTTLVTILVLGLVVVNNPGNPIPLYWGLLILFLQRELEKPSLNEITELDNTRAFSGLAAFLMMLVTLTPFSPSLAEGLGF